MNGRGPGHGNGPRVPLAELELSFARSSGAGGQNVNKSNTKVTLRWDVAHTRSLSEGLRARFLQRFANRITAAGELVINSQRHRDQSRNRADCIAKLEAMLAEVATPLRERRATRPSRAAKERRIQAKRRTSERKRHRGRPAYED